MSTPLPRPRISPADLVTVGNGVCGTLGLAVLAGLWIVEPEPGLSDRELVACLLLYGIGMLCDVLDGPVARRLARAASVRASTRSPTASPSGSCRRCCWWRA